MAQVTTLLLSLFSSSTNKISCPLLWYVLVGSYYLLRLLLLNYPFGSVFLVEGVPSRHASSMFLIYIASFALINSAPSSASAAEDITALIIWAMLRIAPLLGGNFLSDER